MKSVFAILVAILAAGSVYAREIKFGEIVTITGKLGSYTEKEDGFTITITRDDVVIVKGPGDSEWMAGDSDSFPAKKVGIFDADKDPRFKELKKGAAEGKTVTLKGAFYIWQRHVKRGLPNVLMFKLAPA